MVKVMGIAGSPRGLGNSTALLKAVLAGAGNKRRVVWFAALPQPRC